MRTSSRDVRLVTIGALIAFLSLLAAFAATTIWADRIGAHSCVGDWRVDQWHAAIDDSVSVIEIVRVDLVDEPLCSEQPHTPPPVSPPAPAADIAEPTPPPATAAPVVPTSEIEAIIVARFTGHPYVTPQQALNIAWCESRHDPQAKNRRSTASGLWQFLKGTWEWEAAQFGFPTDPVHRFDPVMSTDLAALVMERDRGPRQWLCKG
jgi:hypothetical protein